MKIMRKRHKTTSNYSDEGEPKNGARIHIISGYHDLEPIVNDWLKTCRYRIMDIQVKDNQAVIMYDMMDKL